MKLIAGAVITSLGALLGLLQLPTHTWVLPATGTSPRQDKISEDFSAELRNFCKSAEKLLEHIQSGKVADEDPRDEARMLKDLEKAATSEDEKSILSGAQWVDSWLNLRLEMLRAKSASRYSGSKYGERWAAFCEKHAQAFVSFLKKCQKEKKHVAFECSLCTKGRLTCPACDGKGVCGATMGDTHDCRKGSYTVMGDTYTCSVCCGTQRCMFCYGTGRILCPIDHLIIEK